MSAFSSHSSNPANGAARAVGNPAAQPSEGTACNTMQVAENLGERFANFANVGPSVLDGLAAPSSADDVRGGVEAGTAAGEKITIRHLPLDEIGIGPRHRHDMGDLQVLADSINEIGLPQPIGVAADFTLVFGERRLRAARMLGWTTIATRIVDLPSIVAGEYAENEARKDFTPSERVAIAEAIRAEMGDRRGSNQYVTKERPENFPDAPKGEETRVIAARKAGFGNETTYRQARTVVERGAPNVVAAMDAGEVSISVAARVGAGDWLVSRHLGLGDNTARASPPLVKQDSKHRRRIAVHVQEIDLRRTALLFAHRPDVRFRAITLQFAHVLNSTIS